MKEGMVSNTWTIKFWFRYCAKQRQALCKTRKVCRAHDTCLNASRKEKLRSSRDLRRDLSVTKYADGNGWLVRQSGDHHGHTVDRTGKLKRGRCFHHASVALYADGAVRRMY